MLLIINTLCNCTLAAGAVLKNNNMTAPNENKLGQAH